MVERLGYQRFVQWSLLVFAAGSLLCALAPGFATFTVGRLLQGLGGATFFTAGRMAINELPENSRLTGLYVFVVALLGGSALAPLLGASLLTLGGWRAIFAAGVLLAALVAYLCRGRLATVTTQPEHRSQEHWGWLLWLCAGVFCLQYTIQAIALPAQDLRDLGVVAGISIAMLFIFAGRQWHRDKPLINYRELFQTRYLLGLILYFVGYFLIGIVGLMLPFLLERVMGVGLLAAAALCSLGFFSTVCVALLQLTLSRRWPWHRAYMLTGLVLYGAGCLVLAACDVSLTWSTLLPAGLAIYLGIPLFLGPVAGGTFSALQPHVFSHGYQVKNIVRQLGLSSSVALTTLALHFFEKLPADASPTVRVFGSVAGYALDQANNFAASRQVFMLVCLAIAPLLLIVVVQRVFR